MDLIKGNLGAPYIETWFKITKACAKRKKTPKMRVGPYNRRVHKVGQIWLGKREFNERLYTLITTSSITTMLSFISQLPNIMNHLYNADNSVCLPLDM